MKRFLMAGALAPLAFSAFAQESGGWYITPKAGYVFADDDRAVDDAAFFGMGLGKNLSDQWGLELNAITSSHDRDAGGDTDLTAITADVLRRFDTGSRVTPYLTAGLGGGEDFMFQAGAGLLLRAWESANGTTFSLRPEAKLRWDDAHGTYLQDLVAGIGFQFDFGGAKRSVAAVAPAPVPSPAPAPVVAAPAPVAPAAPADTDGDAVIDDQDRCPGTPRGTAVDEAGCPRQGSITLTGVNFENNSARLLPESLVIVDGVAADLRRYPNLKVEVQGHTDSVGSDGYNQKLSQSRADAVRERLVSQGVAAAQLSAKGYGEQRPVADNATAEGRAVNRRVALEVLDNPGDVDVKNR